MAQLWATGSIATAGGTDHIGVPNQDPTKVRSYNAVPVHPQVPYDQQAEIVEVFHLLKGNGNGNLEVHVTVLNKVGGPAGSGAGGPVLVYEIWVVES